MKYILRSDIPPSTRAEMMCIPLHKISQMNLLWSMDLPSSRAEMPWIPLNKTWQMNLLWPMDPLGTRAEMPWIPLHKTWQMTILWPMDPPRRWSEKDEVHMDNTYACTIQIQTYPPGYEVHKMKCTCISDMHALYRCRHTPQTAAEHRHEISIVTLRWSVQIVIF